MARYIKFAVVAFIVAAPVAYFFWYTRATDEVQRAIVRIGFDPLIPPNQALTLGSFYYVSLDGSHPRPVCNADAEIVKTLLNVSPLERIVASKLVNAHASIQTEILRAVKAEAALEDQLSIEYSFKDTKLYQLDGAALWTLENALFAQTNCNAVIAEYINNFGLVCQVQSALMATVNYVIKRKDGRKIADEDVEKIKGALEVTTDMKGLSVKEATVEGISLFYGVMFKPKCVTNTDAVLVYPQSAGQRSLLYLKLLWRRVFS